MWFLQARCGLLFTIINHKIKSLLLYTQSNTCDFRSSKRLISTKIIGLPAITPNYRLFLVKHYTPERKMRITRISIKWWQVNHFASLGRSQLSCTPVLKVAKPGLDCPFGVPQNLFLSAFSELTFCSLFSTWKHEINKLLLVRLSRLCKLTTYSIDKLTRFIWGEWSHRG